MVWFRWLGYNIDSWTPRSLLWAIYVGCVFMLRVLGTWRGCIVWAFRVKWQKQTRERRWSQESIILQSQRHLEILLIKIHKMGTLAPLEWVLDFVLVLPTNCSRQEEMAMRPTALEPKTISPPWSRKTNIDIRSVTQCDSPKWTKLTLKIPARRPSISWTHYCNTLLWNYCHSPITKYLHSKQICTLVFNVPLKIFLKPSNWSFSPMKTSMWNPFTSLQMAAKMHHHQLPSISATSSHTKPNHWITSSDLSLLLAPTSSSSGTTRSVAWGPFTVPVQRPRLAASTVLATIVHRRIVVTVDKKMLKENNKETESYSNIKNYKLQE